MKKVLEKVVTVVGAGPAGIAAAIQLKRYGIETVVVEKDRIGGLLNNANLVENYPGFPCGITGDRLVAHFEAQLERAAVSVIREEVLSLEDDSGTFRIETSGRTIRSRYAVVATGTRPNRCYDIEIPAGAADRVLYEVVSLRDAAGLEVVVVGAGDAAFDYALSLSRRNRVMILNRGDRIRCLPLLRERAGRNSSIRYREHTCIEQVVDKGEDKLLLWCRTPEGKLELVADRLIFAIGRRPELGLLAADLRLPDGAIVESDRLLPVGDVHNGRFRQAAIAIGEGLTAAMKIYYRCRKDAP
jgi:thioredoxin reductase